jgi:hypothetical protein
MLLWYGADLNRGIMTLSLCSWSDENDWKATIEINSEARKEKMTLVKQI